MDKPEGWAWPDDLERLGEGLYIRKGDPCIFKQVYDEKGCPQEENGCMVVVGEHSIFRGE